MPAAMGRDGRVRGMGRIVRPDDDLSHPESWNPHRCSGHHRSLISAHSKVSTAADQHAGGSMASRPGADRSLEFLDGFQPCNQSSPSR